MPCTDTPTLQPHGWKVIDSDVHTGAAGSSHSSPPHGRQSGVASSGGNADADADPTLLSTGASVEPAVAVAGDRRRGATESSTQSYSRSDSAEDVDDSSTVSETTATEEGWGSGQGSDVEEAPAPGLALGGGGAEKGAEYGNESQATAAAPSKRNSLRRVLDSAR